MKKKNNMDEEIKKVRDYYNSQSESFIDRYKKPSRIFLEEIEEKPILAKINFEGKKVLDIGTGGGDFFLKLQIKRTVLLE